MDRTLQSGSPEDWIMRPTPTRRTLVARAALVALILVPGHASGQLITGTLRDYESGVAIRGAMVSLLDQNDAVRDRFLTDDEGRFSLTPPSPGEWRLGVELLGYRSLITTPVQVEAREWITLGLTLAVAAIPLEPLVVTARRAIRNPDVRRFYERRDRAGRTGFGSFVAREDIELRASGRPTDLLRPMPGVRVVPGAPGRGSGIRMAAGCVPAIFVDGAQVNRRSAHDSVDDYVTMQDIEGIEVYRGAATHQTQYRDPAGCGLVLVWTRSEVHDTGTGLSWPRIVAVLGGILALFALLH
jgi:hypothetical protein